MYTGSIEVRAIRIDATIVDKEQKRVSAIEMIMSCPRLDDREVKEVEKTQRYVGIERKKLWLPSEAL